MREFKNAEEVMTFLQSPDPHDRKIGLYQLYWPHGFERFPESTELIVSMLKDEELENREIALGALCQNIEHFKDPTSLLKQLIDDPAWEIQMNVGSVVAAGLRKIIGAQKCFEEFATLDPHIYWPIHTGMHMLFRIDKEWFRQSEEAKDYICASFYGNYNKHMRLAALDTICRCLPYHDNRVIDAIKAAIEDEDPEIRAAGVDLKHFWILKDNIVRNHQINFGR